MRLIPRRRDPFWDVDGTAARRHRRRSSLVSVVAFGAAFAAVLAAVVAWAGVMGVAPVGVPTVQLIPPTGDLGSQPSALATGLMSILMFVTVMVAAVVAGRVLRPRDL